MITERLKTVISHFELTPSSLADAIGVPRSTVSHVLSGRNKPSLDFVLKLVKKFPEVDLYWFLNGKGEFPTVNDSDSVRSLPLMSSIGKSHADGNGPLSGDRGKTVAKIVIFYADGTFEAYLPKK